MTLSIISEKTSHIYNSLFFNSKFEQALSSPNSLSVKKALKNLKKSIFAKLIKTKTPFYIKNDDLFLTEKYNNIMTCFTRDISMYCKIAQSMEANISFVLQPLATWMNKTLTNEESALFSILDEVGNWKILKENFVQYKEKYFLDIENICNNYRIPYLNLNNLIESDDWLFVDRVHLTDLGYKISSEIIVKELGL